MTTSLLADAPGRRLGLDADLATAWGMIIGERPVPNAVELRFIDTAANSPSHSFSYGQPVEAWNEAVGSDSETYTESTLEVSHIHAFYAESIRIANELGSLTWANRAATAASAILGVIDSPDDTEAFALQVPFDEWESDDQILPKFTGWLRQMVGAYDHPDGEQPHLVRDDSLGVNARQYGKHGTKIWRGSGEADDVYVVEEPVIHRDEYGNRSLMKVVWVAKRQTEAEALRLRNRHDLITQERITRILDEQKQPATSEEKDWILWYADRSQVRSDADVTEWLAWHRNPKRPAWWRRLGWGIRGIIQGLDDLRTGREKIGS